MQNKSKTKKREAVVAKQLAEELGVSISTISRAFSPHAVIAPETRERVLRRAEALGYHPNPFARSLITRKTSIVGIVVSDITNPFYPEVLTGLTEALQDIELNVMLFTSTGTQTSDDAVSLALRYQPDILIVLAATVSSKAATQATQAGTNMIFFNRYVPDAPAFTVTCDNVLGGREVADFLIDSGHRQLAFVSGLPDATTNRDRWKGFSERCAERGQANPLKEEAGCFAHDAGFAATQRLMSCQPRPDAIFCANDLLALGALNAVRKMGLRTPEDVSIIGFDDISMASWSSHALTTYRQPVPKMISTTVDLVRRITAGSLQDTTPVCIAGDLVVRGTVRKADE
ncbi:LacI family DNA-binding transcriptional regulator [Chromohalobacter israelensis]|jgi:DNA-binding LacI/PurR family transcriptional regulator|uniref:LacI family DNA-binding transcriptional regulator n=1 Tax=Chromohalobacter israelensis TaxID=141390 RepID=UPI00055924B1|nr:LacI family DNA-binding transcriptional regulator [Chromohalobacter israelensis]MDF9434132.1 LacI family DNA-binding transcriptional regulator [Chromohalobacter israelensis]